MLGGLSATTNEIAPKCGDISADVLPEDAGPSHDTEATLNRERSNGFGGEGDCGQNARIYRMVFGRSRLRHPSFLLASNAKPGGWIEDIALRLAT